MRALDRLLKLLGPVLRWLGADVEQLRALLAVKLRLDNRREHAILGMPGSETKSPFFATQALYLFLGAGAGILPLVGGPLFELACGVHVFVLTLCFLALVTDYSDILFDDSEQRILERLPINARTALLTRLLHVGIYLLITGISVSATTLITGAFCWSPLYPLLHLAVLVFELLFVAVLALTALLLIVRLVGPARCKDFIVYFQVSTLLAGLLGFLLLPQVFATGVPIEDSPWLWLMPPAWFAAPTALAFEGGGGVLALLALAAILVPTAGLFLLLRGFATTFERLSAEPTNEKSSVRRRRRGVGERLSNLIPGSEERFGFLLSWKLSLRDRLFKSQVWPWVVMMLVFVAWTLREGLTGFRKDVIGTANLHFLLYAAAITGPVVAFDLVFVRDPKPAWIHYALPLRKRGRVMLGALLASLIQNSGLVFLSIGVPLVLSGGPSLLIDLTMAIAVSWTASLAVPLLVMRGKRPFAEAVGVMYRGGNMARLSLLGLAMILPAGVHALVAEDLWGRLTFLILACSTSVFATRLLGRQD